MNGFCQVREAEQIVQLLLADLKACSKMKDLQWGRNIHAKAVESGNACNAYVATALMRMYSKCGRMVEARREFDRMQTPHVVSWNTLLLGYADNGEGYAALELFSTMKARRCLPTSVTYLAVVKACTSLLVNGDDSRKADVLKMGKSLHSEIAYWHLDCFLLSTLIDFYAKCGSMADARQVFDSIKKPDVVSWTSLLLGYAENGEGNLCLDLFSRMKAKGCVPNSVTYVAAIKACTSLAMNGDESRGLELGRCIHLEIGRHLNVYVQSVLIELYAACKRMSEARLVFDNIRKPDVVCWTALLLGYAVNGEGCVSLELFSKMKSDGCIPNSVTYFALVKACASIGSLALGRKFHLEITEFTPLIVTCLVDFYAKCGSLSEARAVFDLHLRTRDLSTCNALLAGYSTYGDTASVFKLFEVMQDEGFRPNGITFLCLLLCCSHAGLVEKAREYIEVMPAYGVAATVMHYTCLVDALGRANQLNEATAVLLKMPCAPDVVIWMTLLCACRKWRNIEIGTWAFKCLMDMDKKHPAAYVLMGQIYGSLGLREEQQRMFESRAKFCVSQVPGEACVEDEAGNMVQFLAGQVDLPEVEAKLEELLGHEGFVAETS